MVEPSLIVASILGMYTLRLSYKLGKLGPICPLLLRYGTVPIPYRWRVYRTVSVAEKLAPDYEFYTYIIYFIITGMWH